MMLGWIVRGLLVVSGAIATLFVSRDATNFESTRMVVAILLFTLLVAAATFWPSLVEWVKKWRRPRV